MNTPRNPRRREAFTLMEILLVLVIIVVLASMAVPMIGTIQKDSLRRTTKGEISNFTTGVDAYMLHMNRYPQDLNELIVDPGGTKKWKGPYLTNGKIPLDQWGNEYQYRQPGERNPSSYDIWSSGPDGQSGTDDDIGNWPFDEE